MAAATPMLQLVNVHAFTAAARAVGVSQETIYGVMYSSGYTAVAYTARDQRV